MKSFTIALVKWFAVVLFIIAMYVFSLISYESRRFVFVSSSPTFNAKAAYLQQNSERFKSATVVAIGSSMTLNNLDCQLLEDSLHQTVINLASWGRTLSDFDRYPIWSKSNTIVVDLHLMDFVASPIETYCGYPQSNNRLLQTVNDVCHFSTYRSNSYLTKVYTQQGSLQKFENFNLDTWGGVLYPDSGMQFDAGRWDYPIDLSKLNLGSTIAFLKAHQGLVKRIVILVSPGRSTLWSKAKSDFVKSFVAQLRFEAPSIDCYNCFDEQRPDAFFIDYAHMNSRGAQFNTLALIAKMHIH